MQNYFSGKVKSNHSLNGILEEHVLNFYKNFFTDVLVMDNVFFVLFN